MGERYSKVADAARMDPMPMDKQLDYVFAMLSEQEKLEIREASFEDALEKAKTAVAMLKQGFTISEICEKTGLSPEDVQALQ